MLNVFYPSTPWFLEPHILQIKDTAQYTGYWFSIILHPGSWRPNISISYLSWCLSCVFNRPFSHSVMLVASVIWCVIQPMDAMVMCHCWLSLLKVGTWVWSNIIYEIMLVDQTFCKPLYIDAAIGPMDRKGNPYLEYMSVPIRTNDRPLQDERSLI